MSLGSNHYIKFLTDKAGSKHAFSEDGLTPLVWDLPKDGKPGDWHGPVEGELRPHYWGLHLVKPEYFVNWFYETNYVAEAQGELKETFEIAVAREARLIRKIDISEEDWNDLAVAWVDDVVDLLQVMEYPGDIADVPIQIFNDIKPWQETDYSSSSKDKARKAYGAAQAYLAYRFHADSLNSPEYVHNSKAAESLLKAVMLLGDLSPRFNREANPPFASNWEVAKEIVTATADAVEHAAQGFIIQRSMGVYPKGSKLPSKIRNFVDSSFGSRETPLSYKARMGLHQKQNALLLQKCGL